MASRLLNPSENHDWYWQVADKKPPTNVPRVIAAVAVSTLVLWGIGALLGDWNELIVLLLPITTLFLFAVMIGAECYCALIATYRVTSLINSHHWDLLRLTPLSRERIFADLYVSVQLRCWNARTVEITSRIIAAELLFLTGLQNLAKNAPALIVFALAGMLLILVLLVSEVRWRFMVVVATSIAVAARIENFLFAALAALATIGGLHLLQVLILSFPFWPMLVGYLLGYASSLADILFLCSLPISLIWAAVLLVGFYPEVRNRALIFAQRELFRRE